MIQADNRLVKIHPTQNMVAYIHSLNKGVWQTICSNGLMPSLCQLSVYIQKNVFFYHYRSLLYNCYVRVWNLLQFRIQSDQNLRQIPNWGTT